MVLIETNKAGEDLRGVDAFFFNFGYVNAALIIETDGSRLDNL